MNDGEKIIEEIFAKVCQLLEEFLPKERKNQDRDIQVFLFRYGLSRYATISKHRLEMCARLFELKKKRVSQICIEIWKSLPQNVKDELKKLIEEKQKIESRFSCECGLYKGSAWNHLHWQCNICGTTVTYRPLKGRRNSL
jgi:lipopolysaccharide biosynthesis regulator YciM